MATVTPLRSQRAPAAGRHVCPACGGPGSEFRSAPAIAADLWMAERYRADHATAGGPPTQPPVHGEPSPVDRCAGCGSLWRTRASLWTGVVDRYRDDGYRPDTLAALHAWEFAQACADLRWYRTLGLMGGDRVLEIGSYVGAFLRLATELGCTARGVDVGADTAAFCRRLGHDVTDGDAFAVAPDRRGYDSVWILNFFDQLPDPLGTLRHVRALLAPGGRVVIHTPDAGAVRQAYVLGGERVRGALEDQLWGVPFLACYSRTALRDLLLTAGFQPAAAPVRPSGGAGWQDATALRPA